MATLSLRIRRMPRAMCTKSFASRTPFSLTVNSSFCPGFYYSRATITKLGTSAFARSRLVRQSHESCNCSDNMLLTANALNRTSRYLLRYRNPRPLEISRISHLTLWPQRTPRVKCPMACSRKSKLQYATANRSFPSPVAPLPKTRRD